MKKWKGLCFFLYLFIGIGAVFGGLAGILEPHSPMGISADILKNSPFGSLLIPGIFLFLVLGLGNIFGFLVSVRFREIAGYLSGLMGAILCLWIIFQCIFIRAVAALHVIYFILGIIQGGAGLALLFCGRQFPYDNIVFFIERFKDRRDRRPRMDTNLHG